MPQPNNVYIDKALTNVSIAYTNPDVSFIADKVFPSLPVTKKSGKYYEFDKSNLRVEHDERAPGTEANEVDYELILRDYGPLVNHALKRKVTREEVQLSDDPLEPFTDTTEFLREKMLIGKEVDAAAKLAAVSGGVTLSGTSQWNDYTNSDPIGIIRAGKNSARLASLRTPNTLALGYQVYDTLLEHPALRERLGDNETRIMTLQKMAQLFGVQNVWVGDAIQNEAVKGASDSLNYIWGKNAYLMYVEPRPGKRRMSATYNLELINGIQVVRWWDQAIKSTWVESEDFYEQKITMASAIYPIKNAIA